MRKIELSPRSWRAISMAAGLAGLLMASACSGDDGARGAAGPSGEAGAGTSCTVTSNADGSATISCDDGTSATVPAGTVGDAGTGCTVTDNGDGTKTITCGNNTVTISDGDAGTPGNPGNPGLAEGQTPGLDLVATVTAPANGTHYVAGDKIVVKYELKDKFGNPVTPDYFSTLALYMSGPLDPLKTVTAVKLLNTTADRTQSVHHYVNLLTTTNTNLVVNGNVITYTMEAITNEDPGTYTIGLRATAKDYPLDQKYILNDVQILTATAEPKIVEGGCDSCHKGAANGQYYMHHVDPGSSGVGSPAIDSAPIDTCKNCHNNEGYAAVRHCADGSKPTRDPGSSPATYTCADNSAWSATATDAYISDAIYRRVHGVHMGEELLSPFNTNPTWGDFEAYLELAFPKDVRNCTTCHQDDAWKNKPSRAACGACHDSIDWVDGGKLKPPRSLGKLSGNTACTADAGCIAQYGNYAKCNTTSGSCEIQVHGGGSQTDDTGCTTCHKASSGNENITDAHLIADQAPKYTVDVTMTAPGNGTYYVAGEAPVVTVVIKQGGTAIDHTTVVQTNSDFSSSYLFVNGPRARRIPQLTSAARADVESSAGPWDLSAATDLQIKVGDTSLTIATDSTVKKAGATAAEVATWLNGNASFKGVAFAAVNGSAVEIMARPSPRQMNLEVVTSTVGTALGLTNGVYSAHAGSSSYAANPIYQHTVATDDDPKATWTTGNITYKLDDVANAEPGTYSLWVRTGPSPRAWKLVNFQVGTGTEEKKIATNCADCHIMAPKGSQIHGNYDWNADLCGSCHDYRRAADDRTSASDPVDGWGAWAASGRSNMGYGAAPISRRVHGMHFAKYVDHPEEIHGSSTTKQADIPLVIFPQDVRNCQKCHSENPSWSEKPSRLACLACHDGDDAKAHGQLMTADPTPLDPWNGDEKESCPVCHEDGADFSVANMHNITNPYKPPYQR
jgi:OmcA/MtrC family decaheme c-type cytochrome